MRQYFGTDGIRGKTNTFPITADVALRIGQAAGQVLKKRIKHNHPTLVLGKDTRLSGYMIESAIQAGFTSVGFNSLQLGPLPTPAVGMLVGSLRADLGVMITASHNPYHDNGIKMFTPDGAKLSDELVDEIEELLANPEKIELAKPNEIGKARRIENEAGRYIEDCKRSVPQNFNLDNMKIVVDCGHGAAYKIAPAILWELGASIIKIGTDPNGLNINKNCGALHPQRMQKAVLESKADIGLAFDGDADRIVVCDEKGNLMEGDHIIAALATYMLETGNLKEKTVVGTVMSNMGLEVYLKSLGINFIRTKVGDHHVEQAMRERKLNLGGEPSGHIIFSDHAPTGDGILAALQLLNVMFQTNKKASCFSKLYQPYTQLLENVSLPAGIKGAVIMEKNEIQQALKHAEESLGEAGRVLVRPSGTEPVIRVMAEGKNESIIQKQVELLTQTISNSI